MDTLSREELVFSLNSVTNQEYHLRKAAFCLLGLDALFCKMRRGRKEREEGLWHIPIQTTSVLEIVRV